MSRRNWIRLAWIAELLSPAMALRIWIVIGPANLSEDGPRNDGRARVLSRLGRLGGMERRLRTTPESWPSDEEFHP